ncbi:MAG: ABC transporter ATP-binding protein [Verrucomicrobium sp.]|nr:ABC transporter ATP-binding protein [Verrucomicrobium sp.]
MHPHDPGHPAILRLENVGLKYRLRTPLDGSRDFWAVKDVSLELRRGETLGVLGSNGAGKSTLMRLISGIVDKDRGKIWKAKGLRVMLLSIGVGFEESLTGRENAILGGMLLGLHHRTILKRLKKIEEFSELREFFDQPVYTYSSGMRMRLGFSVAMEVNPDVLLLDEVLGVGDVSFVKKSTDALVEKIRSDMSVILISHSPELIQQLCTRATWVNRGVTQATGTVEEISSRYAAFMQQGA